MNKQDLIHKIKQLEGISNDERAYLIDLVNTKKKYGLVWEDKPEDVEEQLRENLPVLREVVEKRILSSNLPKPEIKAAQPTDATLFDSQNPEENSSECEVQSQSEVRSLSQVEVPNHILIEGDNLHALTALTFTHEGKIDVIYIDPPYNTGNKDFKYNDRFVDKEDSYRHSKWLSFMHKRLLIAKRLLSDKGVIFISIDDNEQAQLKMLCDSIFSEFNGIGPIIQNKQNAKNDSINVQKNHEYILIYRNTCRFSKNNKIIPSLINSDFKKKDIFKEDEKYYYLNDSITTRGDGGTLNARSNLGHTIYYNPTTKDIHATCDYDIVLAKTSNDLNTVYSIDSELISKGYTAIRPPKVRGKLGCWTWSIEKINNEKTDLIITGKKNNYIVKKRTFVDKEEVYSENGKLYFDSFVESNSRSIIDFSTNDGTDVLNEILNSPDLFNNPKNLDMLKYLFKLIPEKNSMILDFFAGSGTTLHATLALNAQDEGNRQCILVTNNENNICEEVTYVRNKRVIVGYTNAKGVEVAGLANNNLRYYKSEFVPRTVSLQNKKNLTILATELLCIKEDCYTETTTTHIAKSQKWCRIFENTSSQFVIIYDDTMIEESFEIIKNISSQKTNSNLVKVYVFSNGQYPYTEDFEEVLNLVTLCALPDAIYKAYQNVLPKKQRIIVPELEEDVVEEEGNLFKQN